MADGGLPADGPAQVGPVRLPAGRRITGQGRPVVWATDEPVPGAGLAWSALAGVHPQTHLVPILLSGLQGQPSRPWDDGEFLPPADITELDRMDAAGVLASGWADSMPGEEEQEDEDTQAWFAAALAPYGIRFPGLAPACSEQLDTARVRDTLAALEPARVGLVDAGRPADVLALIGWGGAVNRYQTPLPIAAVLRSWEARFAARLLEVGFADIPEVSHF